MCQCRDNNDMGIASVWNKLIHGSKPAEPVAKTPAAPGLGADPIAPDAQRGWGPRGPQGAATVQPFTPPNDMKLDGWLVGKNGVTLPPGTPLDAVAKVVASEG